jgi:hypothetical protein
MLFLLELAVQVEQAQEAAPQMVVVTEQIQLFKLFFLLAVAGVQGIRQLQPPELLGKMVVQVAVVDIHRQQG